MVLIYFTFCIVYIDVVLADSIKNLCFCSICFIIVNECICALHWVELVYRTEPQAVYQVAVTIELLFCYSEILGNKLNLGF